MPGTWVKPNLVDIALRCEQAQEIVLAPVGREVTIQDFLQISDAIHTFVRVWFECLSDHFRKAVRKHVRIPESVDPLSLAVGNYFGCTLCGYNARLPAILLHHCGTREVLVPLLDKCTGADMLILPEAIKALKCRAGVPVLEWLPSRILSRAAILADIIIASGFNPATATVAQMSTTKARLICKNCPTQNGPRLTVYNWCGAVSRLSCYVLSALLILSSSSFLQLTHAGSHGYKMPPLSWLKASEIQSYNARAQEHNLGHSRVQQYYETQRYATVWRCAYCPSLSTYGTMTQAALADHLIAV